jgi:hypothetical protein
VIKHTWNLARGGSPHLSFVILEELDEVANQLLPNQIRTNGLSKLQSQLVSKCGRIKTASTNLIEVGGRHVAHSPALVAYGHANLLE